jgi:spore coat polysaccharide biosynthesis protein SpsF
VDNLVGIIIQARMGSSRLPGKTMKQINGKPLLYYSVQRALQAKYVDKVIVATTDKEQDDTIEKWCDENNISCFRGSEQNVLERYYYCAEENNLDVVVRATADNPFIDPRIIDLLILALSLQQVDYVTMRHKTNTWPYGLDVEAMDIQTLKKVWNLSVLPQHKEHVTLYIKDNEIDFRIYEVNINEDLSTIRLTVDFPEDFERANILMEKLSNQYGLAYSWRNVVDTYITHVRNSNYG